MTLPTDRAILDRTGTFSAVDDDVYPQASRQPTVVSFFTGAGGLDLGFKEAGFKTLFGCDIMSQAGQTFSANFPGVPFMQEDIAQLTSSRLREIVGDESVDVVIGGPPCQGFSNMGNKNSSDPRNYLFESYAQAIDTLRPNVFLFENVKGLLTMFEGRFFERVVNTFLRIGYSVSYALLDSARYGVPQKRERLFIVGSRLPRSFLFPAEDLRPFGNLKAFLNVGDAINDLVKNTKAPNHIVLSHSDRVVRRYKLIPEGGKLPPPEKLPEDIRRRNFGNTYTRLARNTCSSTIVPGNNALPVHPTLDRSLTPREAARIQTFPDDFIFHGERRAQCILVGNAVPPLLAAKLAASVKSYIDGEHYVGRLPDRVANPGTVFELKFGSMPQPKRATLRFADLFAGIGGFSYGLESAGLHRVLSVDSDPYVAEAYALNHSDKKFLQTDLSTKENQAIVAARLKAEKINLIVGGPPCQGFSIFGKRRFVNTRDHDLTADPRNDLVFAFANIVVKADPDWFIMENVPGIQSAHNGAYVDAIKEFFTVNGYRTESRIINAADYGAPQLRRRFLMIGTKTDLIIPFPKPKYFEQPESWQRPYRTVGEVIVDLAESGSEGCYQNHEAPKHVPVVRKRFQYIPEGQKLDVESLPPSLRLGTKTKKPIANYSHIYRRLDRNKPAGTIVPGHNALPIHPFLDRTLTVREAARIQTLPDDFSFAGPIINQVLQVGNAFPSLVAQIFGERLRTVVNKQWRSDSPMHLAKYSMLD